MLRRNGRRQKLECVELFKDVLGLLAEELSVRGPGIQKMKEKDHLSLFHTLKYSVFALLS